MLQMYQKSNQSERCIRHWFNTLQPGTKHQSKSIALPQEQARNTLLNPGSWEKSLERLREGSRVMGKCLGIRAGVWYSRERLNSSPRIALYNEDVRAESQLPGRDILGWGQRESKTANIQGFVFTDKTTHLTGNIGQMWPDQLWLDHLLMNC